jgi:hypothetical protein
LKESLFGWPDLAENIPRRNRHAMTSKHVNLNEQAHLKTTPAKKQAPLVAARLFP